MRSVPSLLALFALLSAAPAFAHGSAAEHAHEHDTGHTAPHGGLVKSTQGHRHLELVRSATGYELYVMDAEMKPLEGAVTEGKLLVAAGKEKREVPLVVQGAKLTATTTPPAGKHQVVAQLKLDGKAQNVKFDVP